MKGKKHSTTPSTIRAAVYARFSSDRQRDASIDDQVEAAQQYCERKGYEIVSIYADYAISGRSDDRPQFLQMVKDAGKGKFEVVVVWKIDRFARNMMDQFHYERELQINGVTLESCKENISGGTIEADMQKGMLAIFAQIRSQQGAVDTMRGMLGKARKCQYLGVTKFGYSHEGDVITLDPATAPLARKIHTDYIAGVSPIAIQQWLIASGVKNSQGKAPGYNFVICILKDWSYAGVYTWGRQKDERGNIIKGPDGKPLPIVRVEDGMPAIVTKSMKQECLRLLGVKSHNSIKNTYPLAGKLYYRDSGKVMCGAPGNSQTGRTYYYYVCFDENKKRHSVRKDILEQSVVRAVREMLRDRQLIPPPCQGLCGLLLPRRACTSHRRRRERDKGGGEATGEHGERRGRRPAIRKRKGKVH